MPEVDPAVRLPLLLALGTAAEAPTEPAVERVRDVLAGVLRDGGSPVMRIAALCSRAELDPDVPVRQAELLRTAWAAWRAAGDDGSALRMIGAAVLTEEGPQFGPVHLLADFGPAAARYADRVRHVMEHTGGWQRIQAAIALWSITGEPEPSASVLEQFALPIATGDDGYGHFLTALRALAQIGKPTPTLREALRTATAADRRLSPYADYRAFLGDQELRSAIETALTLP